MSAPVRHALAIARIVGFVAWIAFVFWMARRDIRARLTLRGKR